MDSIATYAASFSPRGRKTRQFERAPLSGKVDLWLAREKAPYKARDISAGGVFLEADPTLDLGSYASVRVRIPNAGAFTALCRVTRRVLPHGLKVGGVALEFLSLGPKEREWVSTYVAGAHIGRAPVPKGGQRPGQTLH